MILFQWEDKRRLNCPDLLKEFEEKAKSNVDQQQSPSKRESKVRKQVKTPSPRKSKASTADETDEEYQTEDGESMTTDTGTDSTKADLEGGDGDRVVTRTSERKRASKLTELSASTPTSSRRKSNRKIVKQTKSRIATMCRLLD